MNIAHFNKRVEVQRISSVRNVVGELAYGFEAVCYRWAKISPQKSEQVNVSGADQVNAKIEIVLRYDSVTKTITDKDRFLTKEAIYRIDGEPINKNMKNEYLIFLCSLYRVDQNEI